MEQFGIVVIVGGGSETLLVPGKPKIATLLDQNGRSQALRRPALSTPKGVARFEIHIAQRKSWVDPQIFAVETIDPGHLEGAPLPADVHQSWIRRRR